MTAESEAKNMSPLSPTTAPVAPATKSTLKVAADEGREVVTVSETLVNEAAWVFGTTKKKDTASMDTINNL